MVLPDEARHPDVLPRRPVVRLRPGLSGHSGRACPPSAGLEIRFVVDESRVGSWLSLRHRGARLLRDPFRGADMNMDDVDLGASPSETVGPFFHFGIATDAALGRLAGPGAKGERITLRFVVTDGD